MLILTPGQRRPLTPLRIAIALAVGGGAGLASLCAYLGLGPFDLQKADELAGVAVGVLTVLAVHVRAFGIRNERP